MGHYHYLINLDKKQFVHPAQIGNGLKLREQIGWEHSTATALVMLLAASNKGGGRGGGDFDARHPLIGAWAGDRVAFVGDYAAEDDIPGFDAPRIFEECKAVCNPAKTEQRPAGAEAWTNISPQVRAMMAAEFHIQYSGRGWLDIAEEEPQRLGKRGPATASAG